MNPDLINADTRLHEWARWGREQTEIRGYPSSTLEHSVFHGRGDSQDTQGYIDPAIEEVEQVVTNLPPGLKFVIKLKYLLRLSVTDQLDRYRSRFGSTSKSAYEKMINNAIQRVDQGLRVLENVPYGRINKLN